MATAIIISPVFDTDPDEKGIKTLIDRILLTGCGFDTDPDEKGIKTSSFGGV